MTAARRWLVGVLAATHAVAFLLFVQWIAPRPEQGARTVIGVPRADRSSSGRTTDQSIRVGALQLGCVAKAIGRGYSCPKTFRDGVPAKVTYFEMKTVEARLGWTDAPTVLLAIEQDGRFVFAQDGDKIRSLFYWTGLVVPVCLFGISFLLFLRLIRKWP